MKEPHCKVVQLQEWPILFPRDNKLPQDNKLPLDNKLPHDNIVLTVGSIGNVYGVKQQESMSVSVALLHRAARKLECLYCVEQQES